MHALANACPAAVPQLLASQAVPSCMAAPAGTTAVSYTMPASGPHAGLDVFRCMATTAAIPAGLIVLSMS